LDVVGLKCSVVLNRRKRTGVGNLHLRRVMQNLLLHRQLDRIGQLESVAAKELDAVILPGIVRCGNDHAGMEPMSAGEKRDRWRGDHASALRIRPGLTQSGGEGRSDPGAR